MDHDGKKLHFHLFYDSGENLSYRTERANKNGGGEEGIGSATGKPDLAHSEIRNENGEGILRENQRIEAFIDFNTDMKRPAPLR